MLTLPWWSKRILICISLIFVVLLAASCAPAATPIPTPPPAPTFTPTVVQATRSPTATPVAVATPTPVEEEPTPAPEEVPEVDLYLPEMPRITCEELKQLMDEGVDLVLVDTRIDFSFEEDHLVGAMNIPDTPLPPLTEEMVTATLLGLPRDKLIVLYCD